MSGGSVAIDATEQHDTWALRSRLAAGLAAISPVGVAAFSSTSSERSLGFFDFAVARTWRGTSSSLTATLGGDETAGRSLDEPFSRTTARAAFITRGPGVPNLTASAMFGAVSRRASGFEHFSVGGGQSPLLARELTSQWLAMPALPRGVASGQSAFAYRASLDLPPFAWYLWSASTADLGERFSVWHRVVGVEYVKSLARIPLAGTPAARGQIGIGRSLDAPYRDKARVYLSLVINP